MNIFIDDVCSIQFISATTKCGSPAWKYLFLVLHSSLLPALQSSQPQFISATTKCGSPAWKYPTVFRMCHRSPAKIFRSVKRMTIFLDKKSVRPAPIILPKVKTCSLSVHVQCQIDILPAAPLLTMSKPIIVDIPPDPKIPKLSHVQLENICINPVEPSKPTSQPVVTLEDFMQCVNKTEDDRKRKMKEQEQERERHLTNFKKMLFLPNHGFHSP